MSPTPCLPRCCSGWPGRTTGDATRTRALARSLQAPRPIEGAARAVHLFSCRLAPYCSYGTRAASQPVSGARHLPLLVSTACLHLCRNNWSSLETCAVLAGALAFATFASAALTTVQQSVLHRSGVCSPPPWLLSLPRTCHCTRCTWCDSGCHSDSGPGLSPPQAIPLTLQLAEGSSVPRAACQLATCSLLGAGLLLAGSGALAQHQGAGTWEWLDSTYGFILVRISARALRACA